VRGTAVSVVVLVSLLVGGLALELSARRRDDRATAAQAVGAVMRTTAGRVVVLAAWVWLGVHFLAR
jgi:uncharacterized protein DUF6186